MILLGPGSPLRCGRDDDQEGSGWNAMADFGGTDLSAFRGDVRDWIAANFPPSLKGKAPPDGRELSPEQDAWRRAMGEKGWGVPTWPAAYGGGGLGKAEARI